MAESSSAIIVLDHIKVDFHTAEGIVHAVNGVSLKVNKGDIFGIVGYSGAGKSTLVRVINLLQRPTAGRVLVNGEKLLDLPGSRLRSARRKIGMIFQHFNLMNTRTIEENIHYPLRRSHLSKQERKEKITRLLDLVGLLDKRSAYPEQLSGGQKQRVGIARALANDPDILLCDEATSALDPKTTHSILTLLKRLNRELGITIVLITHEMEAVKEICNKVAVMEAGKIIEQGELLNVFSRPKNNLTKDFIRNAFHLDQAIEKVRQQPNVRNLAADEHLVHLSYVGSSTNQPLITQLYADYQVSANILFGNIEILQDVPVGNLIVVLKGTADHLVQAKNLLSERDVVVTPLSAEPETRQVKVNA
jgi:D-methionine transport system ATP-binding protein